MFIEYSGGLIRDTALDVGNPKTNKTDSVLVLMELTSWWEVANRNKHYIYIAMD